MSITVTVRESLKEVDDLDKAQTVYAIEVHHGDTVWVLKKRYSKFRELHDALRVRFPESETHDLPAFPPKQLFVDKTDESTRARAFEAYMVSLVKRPLILNCWPLQHFLEIRAHVGGGVPKRVLFPLPDVDFDPTEVAVPWKLLQLEGFECVFATEQGAKPRCDPLTLDTFPRSMLYSKLGASAEARQYYREMTEDPSFQQPITWQSVRPEDYDALYLVGGHAKGMKQYLESRTLQQHVIPAFFKLNKVVAAICHGVILAARSRDPDTGRSCLYRRKTTTLPRTMEIAAHTLTRFTYGDLLRTYPQTTCEEEVRALQEDPIGEFFEGGPLFSNLTAAHGTVYDDSNAHVVESGNYLSARFPGDAYLIAKRLIAKLSLPEEDASN